MVIDTKVFGWMAGITADCSLKQKNKLDDLCGASGAKLVGTAWS
jgi:hypothetical protein